MSNIITVIIPVYNRCEELNNALLSLKQQTFKKFSTIVIDDGSTQNIKGVIHNYKDSLLVKTITIENSGSPARPRNLGIERANTEWVAFLDSDDWWMPNKLDEVFQHLNSNIDVIYHNLFVTRSYKTLTDVLPQCGGPIIGDPLQHLLTLGNFAPNSSLVIRRNLLLSIGGVSEHRPLIEDYDLLIRLAKNQARFFYLNKPLGYYRTSDDAISIPSFNNILGLINVFEGSINLLPGNCREKGNAFYNYSLGLGYFKMKDYSSSLSYFYKSLNAMTYAYKLKTIFRILNIIALKIYQNTKEIISKYVN